MKRKSALEEFLSGTKFESLLSIVQETLSWNLTLEADENDKGVDSAVCRVK